MDVILLPITIFILSHSKGFVHTHLYGINLIPPIYLSFWDCGRRDSISVSLHILICLLSKDTFELNFLLHQIENSQHRITMILKSLGIAIELCDISAPGMEVGFHKIQLKENTRPRIGGHFLNLCRKYRSARLSDPRNRGHLC